MKRTYFDGANYSKGVCDMCHKRRQVGYIHYIGDKKNLNITQDHFKLCRECWKVMPKNWHPCGCGG